jgi:hypothetical protein
MELIPSPFPFSLLDLMANCHVTESAHKDHDEKQDEYERWHNSILYLSVRAEELTIRSPLHRPSGRDFRVTNVPSPLTFSMLGVQGRESEQSHLRSEFPKRVLCSDGCHFM